MFDNLKEVFLYRKNLNDITIPSFTSFKIQFYPENAAEKWLDILKKSNSYPFLLDNLYDKYFQDKTLLKNRQIFLYDQEKDDYFATVTAWMGTFKEQEIGRLHWLAIKQDYQNLSLAKPLIYQALTTLKKFHNQAYLRTYSIRLKAIRLYLYFGFEPVINNKNDEILWQEIRQKISKEQQL